MVDGREERSEAGLSEEKLASFERAHARGVTVQQIIDVLGTSGFALTEATFRKYVQLGLLPRSVRVGRKGKSRGSQGLYPATVVRRLDAVRRLMGQGYTIDQIQREFLFVRGELDELGRVLERLYAGLERGARGTRWRRAGRAEAGRSARGRCGPHAEARRDRAADVDAGANAARARLMGSAHLAGRSERRA